MQRRDIFRGLTALAILGGARTVWSRPQPEKLEAAADMIEGAVTEGKVRASTLSVRQGKSTFRRAFGELADHDAIFLIASITKPMTATGIMVLVDKEELALDDPAAKYLPEFSDGDRKLITIRHLLTHTSGLPDQLPENVELRRRHAPLKEFVERAMRTALLFKPGARVKYQSMGLLLAAEIAERVTGQPFPKFLNDAVFRPLGMSRTALGLGGNAIADTARCQVDQAPALYGGAATDTTDWDWNSSYWRNLAAPWGGAHSTGPDIEKFLRSFLHPDGTVLKPATASSMIVDQTSGLNEPRGIGFVVKPDSFGRFCSPKTFGHGGSTGTLAWADPATDVSCVILTTLPAQISTNTLLKPVSDLVSDAYRN